jgi:hypothetical protein
MLLIGCNDWPRYQNKPSTNHDALSPDAPPSDGLSVDWAEVATEAEPSDTPGEPDSLALGGGLIIEGILSGLGWDVEAVPARTSTCGQALAFPPAAPGSYVGDVDWISLEPTQSGLLCVHLDTPDIDAQIDVVPYLLDDCGEPVALYVYPDTTVPIGSDRPAGLVYWSVVVEADTVLGVGIAGFWPDDDTLDLDWTAHISLVPAVDGAADALCPEIK